MSSRRAAAKRVRYSLHGALARATKRIRAGKEMLERQRDSCLRYPVDELLDKHKISGSVDSDSHVRATQYVWGCQEGDPEQLRMFFDVEGNMFPVKRVSCKAIHPLQRSCSQRFCGGAYRKVVLDAVFQATRLYRPHDPLD